MKTIAKITLNVVLVLLFTFCLLTVLGGIGLLLNGTAESPWVVAGLTVFFSLGTVSMAGAIAEVNGAE